MANHKLSLSISVNANSIHFLPTLVLAMSLPLAAQQSLESDFRTTGRAVTAAFEPQRAVLQRCSAVILDGRNEAGYGVVVSSEGLILAKASEVKEVKKLGVTVDATQYKDVKILAEDPVWDVVMLKIEAQGLEPVRFSTKGEPEQGTWVVANGATTRTQRRALAGIISAKAREIPATDGVVLGVSLKKDSKTLEIEEVSEKGGAKAAGLQAGDHITAINGKKVATVGDIAAAIENQKSGSLVKVTFLRKGQESTVEVRLGSRAEMFEENGEGIDRNDMMSGDFSKRRSGFPRVIQHDILSSGRVVGGPLLNLDGECVGMNIARANRCENYAIPAEELRKMIEALMKLTPPPGG